MCIISFRIHVKFECGQRKFLEVASIQKLLKYAVPHTSQIIDLSQRMRKKLTVRQNLWVHWRK